MSCWGGGADKTASSRVVDGSCVTKVNHFYNGGAVALLCAVLAVLAGCGTDNIAWLKHRSGIVLMDYRQAQREHAAQRQTMDRLLAASRDCLDAGKLGALCWADLAAYRDCLDAGGSDATCRSRP